MVGDLPLMARLGDGGVLAEQRFDLVDGAARQLDAISESTSELNQNDLADDQVMLCKNVVEEICAQTTRREGADQDVNVEENSHDTLRNTSSSVR